jgi:hypothetical protein
MMSDETRNRARDEIAETLWYHQRVTEVRWENAHPEGRQYCLSGADTILSTLDAAGLAVVDAEALAAFRAFIRADDAFFGVNWWNKHRSKRYENLRYRHLLDTRAAVEPYMADD